MYGSTTKNNNNNTGTTPKNATATTTTIMQTTTTNTTITADSISKPAPKTRSTKNTPTKRELFVSPKDYNGYLMFKLINTPGCIVLFREHDWLQPGSAL